MYLRAVLKLEGAVARRCCIVETPRRVERSKGRRTITIGGLELVGGAEEVGGELADEEVALRERGGP